MGRSLTAAAGALLALVFVVGVAACSSADQTEQQSLDVSQDNGGSGAQGLIAGAGSDDGGAEAESGSELAPAEAAGDAGAQPTVVLRTGPTATPTVDPESEPLAPVESDRLPGVVIPAGAFLIEHSEASGEQDAVATFVIRGVDADELYDWFAEHMTAAGWDEPEDRDGTLIFLHGEQLSARFADEGLQRTATVFFESLGDLEKGTTFTLVVEAPQED
jgi:hypothetical protein